MASKISINTVNGDQRKFVLDLMKAYNVSIFFKNIETKDLDIRNLYEKSKHKALDIPLDVSSIKT